jgi:segregation and condensation protein B
VLSSAAMHKPEPPRETAAEKSAANKSNGSPLSLSRLREAFAAMLGGQEAGTREQAEGSEDHPAASQPPATCDINPRSVVEAMLFVGRPDNRPLSNRELAAAMRGVSPKEIDAAAAELNSIYDRDGAPYSIERSQGGYQLALRPEFTRMRDKFHGKIREAKLSPAALEVLSILAYKPHATADEVNKLRNASSSAAIATLVRWRLVRVDRPQERGGQPRYSTTERFLNLFGLESLEALPHSEDVEKL